MAGGVVALAPVAFHAAIIIAATNTLIESLPDAAQTLFLVDWEYGGAVSPPLGALVGTTSAAVIQAAEPASSGGSDFRRPPRRA